MQQACCILVSLQGSRRAFEANIRCKKQKTHCLWSSVRARIHSLLPVQGQERHQQQPLLKGKISTAAVEQKGARSV